MEGAVAESKTVGTQIDNLKSIVANQEKEISTLNSMDTNLIFTLVQVGDSSQATLLYSGPQQRTGKFFLNDSVNNYKILYARMWAIGADGTKFNQVTKFLDKQSTYKTSYGMYAIHSIAFNNRIGCVFDLYDNVVNFFECTVAWNHNPSIEIYGIK